jgi:hypothetical protein
VSKTALGDEVLALAVDGVPLGLSVGFLEVAGGSRWSPDRRRVTRTRALLDHVAVVRVGAYAGAGVQGVRAAHGQRWPIHWPPWPACAMGKGGNGFGGMRNAGAHPGWEVRRRCLACHRPIVYGERCENCKRELRERKRRKPR